MDPHRYSSIKLLAVSLPLLCLFSLSAASTTVPLLPPFSSATLAADTLRSRGYSIFASLLVSMTTSTNFSGTLFAPPDSVFSFASAMFLNNNRPPPRPSIPLLLYHTLSPPLVLTWPALSTRDDGDELLTFFNRKCLFLLRNSAGEVSISSSPFKNPVAGVKIRQPDLYVDQHLTVHGIDGVLDPAFATRCSVPYIEPMTDAVPIQVNRIYLDRAMTRLWRKGYNVVAAAMTVRRSELLTLTAVTVLAVSDETLFMTPGAFRFDFRHHVVPMRLRFSDFEKMAVDGMQLFTLAANKTVVVRSGEGAVTVDGVSMKMKEVYHNRWIVVVSLMSSLDDVSDSQPNPPISDAAVPSPPPAPGVTSPQPAFTEFPTEIQPTADTNITDSVPSPSPFSDVDEVPSPAPALTDGPEPDPPVSDTILDSSVPSPSPIPRVSRKGNLRRVPSPIPRKGSLHKAPPPAPSSIKKRIASSAPRHVPSRSTDSDSHRTPSPAPKHDRAKPPASVPSRSTDSDSCETPSPAPTHDNDNASTIGSPSSSPSPSPEVEVSESPSNSTAPSPAEDDEDDARTTPSPPEADEDDASTAPSPAEDDEDDARCRLNAVVSKGVEGGDLLCPEKPVRQLRDVVEESKPLDAESQQSDDLTRFYKAKIAQNINIADDVFFYI